MGRWHAHAARRAGAQVTAVFDPDRGRAAHLAARYRGCRPVADVRALLERSEVVHICTPTATHVSLARQALEARRHALVEKPIAPSAVETIDLLHTAERRGVLLCPVHQFLFQDGVQRALAGLATIAPLRHIDISICSAGADGAPHDRRAQIAREILPHPLSILQRILPSGLSALDWHVRSPIDGDICAVTEADSVTISLLVSMSGRPTMNQCRLIGASGTIEVDLFHGFAAIYAGKVSHTRKIMRPFVQAATTAAAAGMNLTQRLWQREPAYPGLGRLVRLFYDAVERQGASPIAAADIVAVARAWDRFAERCAA